MINPDEMDDEQRAQLQQALAQAQEMNQVVMLPVRYTAEPVVMNDGQACVVVMIQTPAGAQRTVLTRENALELASMIRKTANTGPGLVPAPPGLVIPR